MRRIDWSVLLVMLLLCSSVATAGTVTDIDGNVYQTVIIGGQEWMVGNLQVTHYRNGDVIPRVTICGDASGDGKISLIDVSSIINALYRGGVQPGPKGLADVNNDGKMNLLDVSGIIGFLYRQGAAPNCGSAAWDNLAAGAYCEYGNDVNNAPIYGLLYNWFAVSDSRNIAPEGWHVATDAEWQTLADYLGTGAGGKLKEAGTVHWWSPNTGATNESGFAALAGGYRLNRDYFNNMGCFAHFWAQTELSPSSAFFYYIAYDFSGFYRGNYDKEFGFSVRCVKD